MDISLKRRWAWALAFALTGLILSGIWLTTLGNRNRLTYRNLQRAMSCSKLAQIEAILGPGSEDAPDGFPSFHGDFEDVRSWRHWAENETIVVIGFDADDNVCLRGVGGEEIKPDLFDRILNWIGHWRS